MRNESQIALIAYGFVPLVPILAVAIHYQNDDSLSSGDGSEQRDAFRDGQDVGW